MASTMAHAPGRAHHPPGQPRLSAQPPRPTLSALAQFAAEMVTWLWFAHADSTEHALPAGPALSPCSPSRPRLSRAVSGGVTKLQVAPTDRFLRFTHDILQTTQVSHSVVILGLLYISRLKTRNSIAPSAGSEYRLTTTALMIANKVLDDNTYTAKTWAEVSSLELVPLVAGEAEFLKGLDFSLHVDGKQFASWIRLLEGHVERRNAQVETAAARQPVKRARIERPAPINPIIGLGLEGFGLNSHTNSSGGVHRLEVAQTAESVPPMVLGGPPLVRANSINSAPYPTTPCASNSYPTPHTDFLSPHSFRSSAPSTAGPHEFVPQLTPPYPSASRSAPPKRRAAEAFDIDGPPPPFLFNSNASTSSAMGPTNKRLQAAFLHRSYSAGAETAPLRAIYSNSRTRQQQPAHIQPHPLPYLHPSHNFEPSPTEATFAHRRQQHLAPGEVPSLAEANSPRYDPRVGPRREKLVYHSLGQDRGDRSRQAGAHHVETVVLPATRPASSHTRSMSGSQPRPGSSHSQPPAAYAPTFPSHLSISTSPNEDRSQIVVPRSVGASPLERGYSSEGYVSFAGQSSVQQNMLPLPLQRAPQQPYSPLAPSPAHWCFANAGPPGINWGVTPQALEAQGWQSFAPGLRTSTP